MRKFRERNLVIVAAIATLLLVAGGVFALNFGKFSQSTYSAELQTAVGIQSGDVVTIAGVRVGSVSGLHLDHGVAEVTFSIDDRYRLGQDTSLTVKVLNPVGVEYLELVPSGPGHLQGPIPVDRTSVPGTLVSDLNTFTTNTQQTNIPQLVNALKVLTTTLAANSPAQTKAALDGVANLSRILGSRQEELADLVGQADSLTHVLSTNDVQLVDLLGQSGAILQTLNERKQALDTMLQTTTGLARQIGHIIGGDRAIIDPLLASLAVVSGHLAKDSTDVSQAIPLVAAFSRYSANLSGSGPYADFVAPTLVVPDNLVAQCAAIAHLDQQRGCRA